MPISILYLGSMTCPYPSRSPASMPAARTVRLARRLAAGMTPAEVARHEGTDEDEILSLLADEKFQGHVAYYRREAELPEDEREALLIRTAFASLQHLADMGDTKALLFLAYEGNRGRHPENRLRHLAPRMTNRPPGLHDWDDLDASLEPVAAAVLSQPAIEAPENTVAAELVSDLVAFARSNPDVADWVLRYAESRQAALGESGAGAVEQQRSVKEEKSSKG